MRVILIAGCLHTYIKCFNTFYCGWQSYGCNPILFTSCWDCNKSTKPRNKSLWQQTYERRLSKLPYYISFPLFIMYNVNAVMNYSYLFFSYQTYRTLFYLVNKNNLRSINAGRTYSFLPTLALIISANSSS